MSYLDLDIDEQMKQLEFEWRQAYEASVIARAEYHALAAGSQVHVAELGAAAERLQRAEACKARIMAKIERLEDSLLDKD
jgi:hypothetical protein